MPTPVPASSGREPATFANCIDANANKTSTHRQRAIDASDFAVMLARNVSTGVAVMRAQQNEQNAKRHHSEQSNASHAL